MEQLKKKLEEQSEALLGVTKKASSFFPKQYIESTAQRIGSLLKLSRTNPKAVVGAGTIILLFLFWIFSDNTSSPKEVDSSNSYQDQEQRPEISGVKQAVDPRAKWTAEISNDIRSIKELVNKQSEENKSKINRLTGEIEQLKQKATDVAIDNAGLVDDFGEVEERGEQEQLVRVKGNSGNNQPTYHEPPPLLIQRPIRRKLGHIKIPVSRLNKDVKDYITTGSFARAVLLTGVVAGTGTQVASSPSPVLVRLTDHAIFSKAYKTEQIKEAILIGSCVGKANSDRAECRVETLSLVNRNGQIIEKQVEGWLIGEDGRPGIRGVVVDKSSDLLRMSILTGMLSGMSQFFQNQATSSVYPISPFIGQQNALGATDSLKAGGFAGMSNALEKVADYGIRRAEQLTPVIVIASGREIDVVFKKGFSLKLDDDTNFTNNQLQNKSAEHEGDIRSMSPMQTKFLDTEDLKEDSDQNSHSPSQRGF